MMEINEQVKEIPHTFSSTTEYLNSFVVPLIEETHADLLSNMTKLSQAPLSELRSIERHIDYKAPTALIYKIVLRNTDSNRSDSATAYRPQSGDLVALTDVKPKCISDLNRPKMPFLLAIVQAIDDFRNVFILSSKLILNEQETQGKEMSSGPQISQDKVYCVFLINMTTSLHIWNALHPNFIAMNQKMMDKLIQINGTEEEEDCAMCVSEQNFVACPSFKSYGLNDSQEAAITSCINTWRCHHQNAIKLIWGPPGTGKTKTIAFLLFSLLRMNCRVLTCAPTNTAVVAVASKLIRLVKGSTLDFDSYGFGDIVLVGKSDRLSIKDNEDLLNVLLNDRANILCQCFSPTTGWKTSLVSMIDLLEDPELQYCRYLADREPENSDENYKMDGPITIVEFVKKRYSVLNERLEFCIVNMCTHLPTHLISLELMKRKMVALDLLKSLRILLSCFEFGYEGLKKAFDDDIEHASEADHLTKLGVARTNCLQMLQSLPQLFPVPDFTARFIRKFCLDNTSLIFCTSSSSYHLFTECARPMELLVIDEAAQLKECESTIPFQLPGLRHAILVGDDRQLPAMVQSQISAEAEFGRSLFERLVSLGQKKQLLNIQYRMHPAISSFPNNEFYDGKILDATMVRNRSHEKRFLHGHMFGAYSFINVPFAKEQFDGSYGLKNMIEVFLVCDILASLFKDFSGTKQGLSIGVISPYRAQVNAIREKIKEKYAGYVDSGFSVSIRTVDGFQGGEEDVIIFSTVRCNINGSIGFLSNRRRTNVALTRARHCLWILGNEATFAKSESVWKRLVLDAKQRGCFFNADENKDLAATIVSALTKLKQFDTLLRMDSPLFKGARWKVCFENQFWKSMASIKNRESHKQMLNLLQKLSSGWRQSPSENNNHILDGSSGLLQVYPIHGILNLLWSVDIIEEDSKFIQVLKVWNILPLLNVPKVAENLEKLLGEYEASKMSRCKSQCLEGNLVVPMSWPKQESNIQNINIKIEDGITQGLSRPLVSLNIVDESRKSNNTEKESHWKPSCIIV